ncbi:MAG: LacI family DNA-binding transcriptional regulator [Aristaeellaceae bacterium]
MGVTMRDIGKRIGVSAVTVSKALSGKSGVSEEMRQKIVKLAAELGYVNPNAQPGRPGKGLDVGIIVPDQFFSNDTFYAMFYKLLMQTLSDAGHFGILELASESLQNAMTLPNIVRSSRVDALIVLGQPTEAYTRLLVEQQLPVVTLDFYYAGIPVDAIIGDSAFGAAALTQHLIAKGHRDIGFLGNAKATSSIMERYLGFTSAMLMHDLPVRPECVVKDRDDNNVLLDLTLPEKLPTAFVCNCDVLARTLIDTLQRRGVRVPEDVSVVGYDDFNNVPGSLPLTTFRVDTAAMCRMAVKLVEERCAGDRKPVVRTVVGGECVYRDSVRAISR